jgi:hypothetical protein
MQRKENGKFDILINKAVLDKKLSAQANLPQPI